MPPEPPTSADVEFASLDGLVLRGTLTAAAGHLAAAVLVHGGGVTREEGGFFTRLAAGLADAGIASLRFDLRGHGASEGRQEDLTLAGILNDIRAAADHLQQATRAGAIHLIGASFGGGIAATFAARHPDRVRRLVLINPLIEYKKRFVDDKPYWHDDHLDPDAARDLTRDGALRHSPTFRLGRPLLNEVFHLRPEREIAAVRAPTLFVHGTGDTFIPVDSSRHHAACIDARLLEIDSAQHGIAVHDDPTYAHPQTQVWQSQVITAVSAFLSQA